MAVLSLGATWPLGVQSGESAFFMPKNKNKFDLNVIYLDVYKV